MQRAISTHVFLKQRLHPGLLDTLARSGADGIELFGAREHFDYASRSHVREIGDWFRSNATKPHSMHGPMFPDAEMGRSGAPAVNLVHPEKARRIQAMDEMKRALEVAEAIPYAYLIMHLGERQERWLPATLEYAITALEHLRAFARPLGVQLALENILNEVTDPANLVQILSVGHFDDLGVCLDTGHAHIKDGVVSTIEALRPHISTTHLHDNSGAYDEHLWPVHVAGDGGGGAGTIAWVDTMTELRTAPRQPAAVLEIHYSLGEDSGAVRRLAERSFRALEEAKKEEHV